MHSMSFTMVLPWISSINIIFCAQWCREVVGPFPRGIDLYFFREQTNKGFQNVSFPKYSGRSLLSLSLSSIFKVLSERKKKKNPQSWDWNSPCSCSPGFKWPTVLEEALYTRTLFPREKSNLPRCSSKQKMKTLRLPQSRAGLKETFGRADTSGQHLGCGSCRAGDQSPKLRGLRRASPS